jgi:hypothetical protein
VGGRALNSNKNIFNYSKLGPKKTETDVDATSWQGVSSFLPRRALVRSRALYVTAPVPLKLCSAYNVTNAFSYKLS